MQNQGLLFIPDISGFTRFVTETEIEHSRLIIQELLEVLINTNQIGLEISEIEGDAILFYRFGETPSLEEVYHQVEKMFTEFHRHLATYDLRKYCQCKACLAAVDLTLKVISHYGEFTEYTVRNFSKLIGKDVIVAHQLLKNDIQQHEYWLVTKDLLKEKIATKFVSWMNWESSFKQTEVGEIPFEYVQLGPLRESIAPDPPLNLELQDKTKMITLSKNYNTHLIALFHATGDFSLRPRWMEGVKSIIEYDDSLPRMGMKCHYLLDSGEMTVYSVGYTYTDTRIEFSEVEENKNYSTTYTLEEIDADNSKLTIDYYIKKNSLNELHFEQFEKEQVTEHFKKSIENLDKLVQEIEIPRLGE